jgi:pimeloyl-ACP methyl ester carboxylesterase
MSVSEQLGERKQVALDQGTISYRERGTGEPIVFVHGLLVNGDLWRKVVPELSKDFRCITPDWPLGSHELPLNPDADLTPPGLARLIADFLAALEVENVTLVGNDTGGGISQLVVASHPERLGRLVLTNCDAYENFPPRLFKYLIWTARVPGGLAALLQPMRLRALRRTPIAFGWLAKSRIDDETLDSYSRPAISDRAIRRDLAKAMKDIDPSYTLEAARAFPGFDRPVLLAWAREKAFFPTEHAERLARDFPAARVEWIEDSYTFVPEDQPQRLAELIGAFAREPAAATARS